MKTVKQHLCVSPKYPPCNKDTCIINLEHVEKHNTCQPISTGMSSDILLNEALQT